MPETPLGEPRGIERNVTLFLLFRVFFNARFYYPIFAILFLDFGLTWTQFYLLNTAWAIASIVLEVPSGALADQLGRRTLVLTAAVFMVLEMLILCLTPMGGGTLVFVLFLLNRIISGAAEAAASGADEALAYDSIPEEARETTWPVVQGRLIAYQAIGMSVALLLGAFGYNLNKAAELVGWDAHFSKEFTTRLPLWMCLGSSLLTFFVTLFMREPPEESHVDPESKTVVASFRRTLRTGRWIVKHSAPLMILLILVSYDSIVRLFYTVSSSYYRVIEIEPVFFGFIGVAGNLFGMLFAPLISNLIATRSARFNYVFGAAMILFGLLLIALQAPYWGLLVILPLGMGMRHIHAVSSHYLNRVTDSAHRATVLSFRGLALMIGYGIINLVAIGQIWIAQPGEDPAGADAVVREGADDIIRFTSPSWWLWFVVILAFLGAFRRLKLRQPIDEVIRHPNTGKNGEVPADAK